LRRALWALVWITSVARCECAFADLRSATDAYQKHDFDRALTQFWDLAQLGNVEAQYALGVMYLRGEGANQNTVLAYGWLKLAADSKHARALQLLPSLRAGMLEESIDAAERWSGRYTPQALQERLLPAIPTDADCVTFKPPKVTFALKPKYPTHVQGTAVAGAVALKVTVAPNGSIRDIHIIRAFPPNIFEAAVLEAVPQWQFEPAKRNGVPLYSDRNFTISFNLDGADAEAARTKWVHDLKTRAEADDPVAQYTYALVLSSFEGFQVPPDQVVPWLTKSATAGVPIAQYELGDRILSANRCRPAMEEGLVWLLAAAQGEQTDAQTELGRVALRVHQAGETAKALFWLRRASDRGDLRARKYLASVLATSADDLVRNPQRALELTKSIPTAGIEDPTILDILAAASANTGNYSAAVGYEQTAIKRAHKLKWHVDDMQSRLVTYKSSQAWYGELIPF
jgi:TonB family protein